MRRSRSALHHPIWLRGARHAEKIYPLGTRFTSRRSQTDGCFDALAQDLRAILRLAADRGAELIRRSSAAEPYEIDAGKRRSRPLCRCQTQARLEGPHGGRYGGTSVGSSRGAGRCWQSTGRGLPRDGYPECYRQQRRTN